MLKLYEGTWQNQPSVLEALEQLDRVLLSSTIHVQ